MVEENIRADLLGVRSGNVPPAERKCRYRLAELVGVSMRPWELQSRKDAVAFR